MKHDATYHSNVYRRYAIDATKAATELDWRPSNDFQRGLEATVRWYLAHREWCAAVQSGSYERERLGLTSNEMS